MHGDIRCCKWSLVTSGRAKSAPKCPAEFVGVRTRAIAPQRNLPGYDLAWEKAHEDRAFEAVIQVAEHEPPSQLLGTWMQPNGQNVEACTLHHGNGLGWTQFPIQKHCQHCCISRGPVVSYSRHADVGLEKCRGGL